MKQKLKRKIYLRLLLLGVPLLFYQCQRDDLQTVDEQANAQTNQQSINTSTVVSGKDIPNIIDFVKRQTNERLQVRLKDLPNSTRQADLIIGNLSTDLVKQVTNQYGRSNYTFTMSKDVDTGELSYINYIVKDTRYGVYGYFIEYAPDFDWTNGNFATANMRLYTGDIRVYNQYGIYVGANTFTNGLRVNADYRGSCGTNTDGTSNTGGGSTGNGSGTPGPSGNPGIGSTGGDAGGPVIGIIVDITVCGCEPHHEGGSEGDGCSCTKPDTTSTELIVKIADDYYNKTGKRDPLRHPCPPEDTSDQNCRCPNPDDVPDGQDDVDPEDENDSTGVLLTLDDILRLNTYLEPNLTLPETQLIAELGIYDELFNYLQNNVDPNNPITFEEALNRIRPCNLYNNLENNQDFKDKMQMLKTGAQNDNFETAFKMTSNGNGEYDFSEPIQGEPNSDGLDPQVEEDDVIDGFIHNHYDREGSLSIFSPHDLWSLYNWLTNDNIGNTARFVYAVTTSDNTTYAITITDPQAFIAFGDLALEGLQFEEPTNDFMIHEYNAALGSFLEEDGGINDDNEPSVNEKNYLKLLTTANSGLKFFKSDTNFENWQQLNFNSSTGSVNPQNCN